MYNGRAMQQIFPLRDLQAERSRRQRPYFEFLRVSAMSAGVYVLPAGGTDEQKPHREDEIYYVLSGRAHMRLRQPDGSERDFAVATGDTIFVPGEQEHRFHNVEQELSLLVFFAPAESTT